METGEQTLTITRQNTTNVVAGLLARARTGDTQSFDEIMILHQRQVFRTAYRILGHLEDAQDAAQEVFLRLYKYLNRFDQSRGLSPWLYRITVNVCHDIARKRPKTTELTAAFASGIPDGGENNLDLTAERRIMADGLKTLPEKERAAVVLRDIEGLSTKEVAEILGSSETTVRSQISRGRVKLKEFHDRNLRRQS